VVVHNRSAEDGESKAILVTQCGAGAVLNVPSNPSRRRDGLSVAISCEQCDRITWLHIYQHKGQTFVETGGVGP
jgi:hypothetical protein